MQKNDLITLSVTEINNLGAGVGKHTDGRVVFVHGAVTGDTVEARVIKINKNFLVARLERVITPSPWRLPEDEAFCHAPAACGGCVYRHITYAHELELKQNYVKHAFIKAGLPDVEVEAVRNTGQICGYRNKAQYPFGQNKNGICVGFYAAKSHTLIPSGACPMQPGLFSQVAEWICRYAQRAGWTVYEEETRKGLLRHLYLRYGEGTDQLMVCLVLNGKHLPDARPFIDALTAAFPQTVSVMLNFNTKNTNVVLGEEYRLLHGTPYIEDVLCGKTFRISPQSFYQVNHDGAQLLYSLAAERTGMNGQGTLLDLYCGIGSIGLSMAERAERLVGIEIVESAVQCARENAARNGVSNAVFSCGDASDAEKLLDAAEREYGKIDADVVILDPPRKGSTPELITYLCNTRRVPRIVYVSCDPDTLARDCALFRELGYEIGTVTPVDMFPRTGHVESVVRLSRQSNIHQMKLAPSPFEMIRSGEKTIELRLFDEKRRQVKVGDQIVFTNTATGEICNTAVLKLHRFDSFEELYRSLPLLKCGYTPENIDNAKPSDMEQYYSAEDRSRYGVVGIELCRQSQRGESDR